MTGVLFILAASLLNIAAFSGFRDFNPDGQLHLFGAAIFMILIMITGVLLVYRYYKTYGTMELLKKETE